MPRKSFKFKDWDSGALKCPVDALPRQRIVAMAHALLGTPYKDMGRTTNGLDCLGLVKMVPIWSGVVNEKDIEKEPTTWGEYHTSGQLADVFNRYLDRVTLGAGLDGAKVGDVVLFLGRLPRMGGRDPAHSGILINGVSHEWGMIHAEEGKGEVTRVDWHRAYERFLVGVWRYPGV